MIPDFRDNVKNVKLSVLDLAPIPEGATPADTFRNSAQLAQAAEAAGYHRYWLAEHHNMPGVASAATSILIGHIAGKTSSIRVGSGGIMLPNHAPLIIAEQFGTLESLYPGRIDLGLGRAPGTDQITSMALRRHSNGTDFASEIRELKTYFSSDNSVSRVRAIPGEGLDIPIWILGSSTDSAYLAGALGLPYAFASHFAPAHLHHALQIYREQFRPSEQLSAPYTMACVNVIAASDDAYADKLATSFYQLATGIVSGKRRQLQAPVDSMEGLWTEYEEAAVRQMMAYSFIGGKERVLTGLRQFLKQTVVDELMVTAHIYDPNDRIKSYQLLADWMKAT